MYRVTLSAAGGSDGPDRSAATRDNCARLTDKAGHHPPKAPNSSHTPSTIAGRRDACQQFQAPVVLVRPHAVVYAEAQVQRLRQVCSWRHGLI